MLGWTLEKTRAVSLGIPLDGAITRPANQKTALWANEKAERLRESVYSLNSRGLDRIVKIGIWEYRFWRWAPWVLILLLQGVRH